MATMVRSGGRIIIVPFFVVDRNSHFGRIPVVQTVGTSVVLFRAEVLWIVYVGVMVEAVPVLTARCSSPILTEGLLSFCDVCAPHEQADGSQR